MREKQGFGEGEKDKFNVLGLSAGAGRLRRGFLPRRYMEVDSRRYTELLIRNGSDCDELFDASALAANNLFPRKRLRVPP